MIVLKRLFHNTRLLCPCVLCALLAAPASGACADYTAGTPGGAGKVAIDPETGDRKVEVTAPPPSTQTQQQMPVYVYPQVGGPRPRPSPPGHKALPPPSAR